jgi:NAD(P)-dependent dehydrogenase (short-subunit alcohol dehydrogenase family)
MELAGARALVTGGASGIGAEVVRMLRAGGATVALLDRSVPEDDPAAIRCDVSDEDAVVSGFSEVRRRLGGLDAAVLSAGVGGMSSIVDMSSDEWDRVMGTNLRGLFLCLRESARQMVAGRKGGTIVAVSSISGLLADRLTAHYNVSKAGVHMLVRVAARELGPQGVRVNAVAPGTTATPMFAATDRLPGYRDMVSKRAALGRLGEAGDVAAAVVALVGLDWVTGQTLVADGGLSLFSPIDAAELIQGV